MKEKISDEEIAKKLLFKLYWRGCWGTRHTSESNLPKGFPQHVRGRIIDIAKDLRKRGFLIKHPTHYEAQWHLNWNRKKEIEEMISDLVQKKF